MIVTVVISLFLLAEISCVFYRKKLQSDFRFHQKIAKLAFYLACLLSLFYLFSGVVFPLQKSQLSFSNNLFISRSFFSKTAHKALYANPTDYSSYGKKEAIYILYDVGCSYCQKALPEVLDSLSEKEKDNVVFVNYDTAEGHQLAVKYHILKKSTAIVVRGTEYTKYQLAFEDNDGNIVANQKAIATLKKLAGTLKVKSSGS
ncbi:hypothetical protein ACVRZ8_10575 [Streptococcus dentiloxodontae]